MAWATMASNSCPNTNEVTEGEAAGDLDWRLDPPSGLPAATSVWHRDDYVLHIFCDVAAVSAAIPAFEVMTKQEMIDHAEVKPTTVADFTATHVVAQCPTLEVELTWDNGLRDESKVLEHSTDNFSWSGLSLPGPTDESYTHTTPAAGQNFYRIRYSSEVTYADDSVVVTCPE